MTRNIIFGMWNVTITPLYYDDMPTIISNFNDQRVEKVEQYKQLGLVIYEHFELFAYLIDSKLLQHNF